MKKAMSITIFLLASAIGYAMPTVSNETAKQRYPWGLVDITCTVSGIDGTTDGYKFALEAVMPDSGNTNKVSHFWVVQNGTNSTDRSVHINGNYRLLWDASADLGQVRYSNMVVRITWEDIHKKVQLWEGGPYWAETNIGAEKPWECGYYFWWGDTIGYKRENDAWVASDGSSIRFPFSEANALTYNKSRSTLQKQGWITSDNVLAPAHDAAQVQWGVGWRIPTHQELTDLNSKCDWIWTTTNGVNGWIVRGRGDYTSVGIFLPAAGTGTDSSLWNISTSGGYWSSLPDSDLNYVAWFLHFGMSSHATDAALRRSSGIPIRPVQGFATAFTMEGSEPFLLDTTITPKVATPVITPSDGSSFVGDTCLVAISCATDGADIYFSTRGTPPRIRESNRYTGAFEISDTTCVMAIALKENVTSEVAVVTISRRELTIPEAAGAMELTFETGGDADWTPIADASAASGYSVRSGAIGGAPYGTSNVTWLVTEVEGMGTFSFRWKVDCEHDYTGMCLWDRLVVFTNGVEAAKIDGSQDWADVSLRFADSGRHSIRWLFLKDDEDDDGASFEDCAWVSGVKWTPAIVVADTEYDIGEMPETVTVLPGVTLNVKVGNEPTEGEIAALAARVTVSPKSPDQNVEYFKVVGNYDSAKESIALKVVFDDEAIELAATSQEVLDAVVDQAFVGGEVSLPSAKSGLYYGIVVVDDLSKMEAASLDVVFVKAGENGVHLTVPKPQGPTAFFKIVVSDVGNE